MSNYIPIIKAPTQQLSRLRREQKLYANINGTLICLSKSISLTVLREYIDKRILFREVI